MSLFEDVVRWGALENMYAFIKPSGPVVAVPTGLDNIRVTGYDVAGDPVEISPWRWGQTAVVKYVLQDRQVVRNLVDRQIWVSEDEGKTWYRDNPPPLFN